MRSILLIDDDHIAHKLVGCFVKLHIAEPVELVSADTIGKAVELLRERSFDIVLLDNRLEPATDARETLPVLRELAGDAKLFVISAHVDEPYMPEVMRRGASAIIDKFELKKEFQAGRII